MFSGVFLTFVHINISYSKTERNDFVKLFFVGKKAAGGICMVIAALFIAVVFGTGGAKTSVSGKKVPIYCVQTEKKQIAVTFDSAWDDTDLSGILDTLKKYECKATFFVVGNFLDKYPDMVKKMYGDGNEIANHSDTHPHPNGLSEAELIKEMDTCDEKIRNITGQKDVLFRAPYGEYNDLLVQTCENTGRFCIQWDTDTQATLGNALAARL